MKPRSLTVEASVTRSKDYQSHRATAGLTVDLEPGEDAGAAYAEAWRLVDAELAARQEETMAVIPRGGYQIIDSGKHYLRFVGAFVKRIPPLMGEEPDGPDGKVAKLEIKFESSKRTADGRMQELDMLCAPRITPKNKLGRLAMQMHPGLNVDLHDFDPELYEGLIYNAYITHEMTDSGKVSPKLAELTYYSAGKSGRDGLPPLVASAPAAAAPDAHPAVSKGAASLKPPPKVDPFADDPPEPAAPKDDPFADD